MGGTRNSKDIVWTYAVMYRLTHLSSGILRFDYLIGQIKTFLIAGTSQVDNQQPRLIWYK